MNKAELRRLGRRGSGEASDLDSLSSLATGSSSEKHDEIAAGVAALRDLLAPNGR